MVGDERRREETTVGPGDEVDGADGGGRARGGARVDDLMAAARDLDGCDAYAVVVVDPQTGEIDVHGPLAGPDAVLDADRRRQDHDAADLSDVRIEVVRLHLPEPARGGRHSAPETAPHTAGGAAGSDPATPGERPG